MRFLTIIIFILWTTIRHEGSHALVAYTEGAEILELKLLPGIHKELGFYFGYVKHSGDTSWLTEAAPFFSDTLCILISLYFIIKLRLKIQYRYLIVFGIISPVVDLIYNYQGGFWREGSDVNDLFNLLPNWIVHIYFILSILLGFYVVNYYRRKKIS